MTLQETIDKTFERMKSFNHRVLLPALRASDNEVYEGAIWDDVMNTNGCANYIFSTCLVDVLKPKQVVELGGAMGTWSLCVPYSLPQDSKLYSITLPVGGLEFKFVVDVYPNFHPIVGDDLDMKNWEGIPLKDTDIWYFDSLHTKEQLKYHISVS